LNGRTGGFLLVATFELHRGWVVALAAVSCCYHQPALMLTAMYSGRIGGRVGPRRMIAAGSLRVSWLCVVSRRGNPVDSHAVLVHRVTAIADCNAIQQVSRRGRQGVEPGSLARYHA